MAPLDDATSAEQKHLDKVKRWTQTEGAYALIQSTKPQSLAYGLNDSPAGHACWIVEKFKSWSDNDGDIEEAFSKDELLTNPKGIFETLTTQKQIFQVFAFFVCNCLSLIAGISTFEQS